MRQRYKKKSNVKNSKKFCIFAGQSNLKLKQQS